MLFDFRLIIDSVRAALEEAGEFEVVGEATNGTQVLNLVKRTSPDVVMLDTRTDGEFCGTTVRAARGGCVPGAVHLEWTNNLDEALNVARRVPLIRYGRVEVRPVMDLDLE